jgi:hypothetical protein
MIYADLRHHRSTPTSNFKQFAEKLTLCTSGHPFSDAVSCSKIRPF